MDKHYTTEQLKARGWTTLMIKTHLGKADEIHADPVRRLGKPIRLYRVDRVMALETGAAKGDLDKRSEARELAQRALRMKKQKMARGN